MAEAATAEFEGKFGMGGPWGHLLGKPYRGLSMSWTQVHDRRRVCDLS